MNRREALDGILKLAAAEPRAERSLRADLRVIRSRLEDELGQTVRPAEAAGVLGVSQPALAKWLDKGEIASVITPRGRREIPVSEVVDLVRDVEQARRGGRTRAISAVIRERRTRAAETIDLDRVVPPQTGRTHRRPELQSLAYHRLVAERLTPELVDEARARIDQWQESGRLHAQWAAEWRAVLDRSVAAVAEAIAADSEQARRLRQTSPFAGVLTEHERKRLLDAVDARGS